MAEAVCKDSDVESASEKSGVENHECAVCLQPCVHPAQLPCGHIFCFLCVKGIANQSKKCAMCRQEIPRDFIEQPNLLNRPALETSEGYDGGYQWFYEGRNGWWQYDERTSKELETSYKEGERTCELLIAGFLYIVDLENMVQLRRNEPSRRRNIKRDFATIPKKGIAGLRTDDSSSEGSENRPIEGRTHHNELPVTPSNTPQSPTSGRESPRNVERDSQAIVDLISSLNLDSAINELVDDDEDEDTLTTTSSSSVCNKGHNHFKFPNTRK